MPKRIRIKNHKPEQSTDKKKKNRKQATRKSFKLNMKKIGLDIKKAKQACRIEINEAKKDLKTLVTKYSELVSLEKLMREVTKRKKKGA